MHCRPWTGPALLGLLAWLGVLLMLDPAGSFPDAPQGPGLTVDESFNVQQGVFLFEAVRAYGPLILDPASVREVFGHPAYLADHPPLGRFWLGLWHQLSLAFVAPENPASPFVTIAARTGSAAAFGLTVFLVGWFTTRWYGGTAGLVASAALILMPRVFGHAHLASLETCMNLTWAAAVLSIAESWTRQLPSWKTCGWTGLVLGLALLTKIQGVLLVVPVGLWALWHWRQRAIVPLAIWGLTGLLVFFLGWPWLWLDPFEHLREYFGRTTDRAELFVWYFGQRMADKAVPWHYPFVMFLVTVPVGLHILGFLGLKNPGHSTQHLPLSTPDGIRQPREQLLLAALVFPLLVFALPGVAVYDGARLFLIVFPIWAIFIGRGGSRLLDWLQRKFSRRASVLLLTIALVLQGFGLVALAPVWLSYYNLLTGGLRGAQAVGLELNYWGDSLTRTLFEEITQQVPPNATIAVAPVLHQFQLDELLAQSPILRRHGLRLVTYDEQSPQATEYLLLFRRRADLPGSLRSTDVDRTLLAEVRREGVQLAALYRLSR